MRRPGSAGRITSPIGRGNFLRSPGSTAKSSARWRLAKWSAFSSTPRHNRLRPVASSRRSGSISHASIFSAFPRTAAGRVISDRSSYAEKMVWQSRFHFNAWAKYRDWKKDDKIPERAAQRLKLPLIEAKIVLEGGSIDVNGRGTLLTTEECLLDPQVQTRNPGLSRLEIETVFRDTLGITNTLWLGTGIAGDDTHGHVDDLCRFVKPGTVGLRREDNPKDVNYKPLAENRAPLQGMHPVSATPIEGGDIPSPPPFSFDGVRP